METISFTFDSSKDMSNTELSSFFRSETAKFESMEKISNDQLLSIFSECLKFYTRNLDSFLLNDLVYLIRKCWHENPEILWEQNSDQIIKMSKENFNGMTIVASISAFTSDMQDTPAISKSKDFFEKFVGEGFKEINENYDNIENRDCDSFLVFNLNLDRKQFFHFLLELIQDIPYSDIHISKYLPCIINEMPTTSIYTLYSFYITNNMIYILPRSIFLDKVFLKFTSPTNSLILLNKMNEEEFLTIFPSYYQKIYESESNNSELAYSFLTHISKTDSEQVFNFMNKSCMEGKSRIQQIIDFASNCEFSEEVIINLKKYKFRLPANVSKKFKSLDGEDEYLAIISNNPLKDMDRDKLDHILLESENPLVYYNLFRSCHYPDDIYANLQFWSHAIPLLQKTHEFSICSLFIQVDRTNSSVRVSRLLLHNFPQNMKPAFFDFAKSILDQNHDFESFLNADETLELLSKIDYLDNYLPFQFWKLFISVAPINSIINNDYEGHLALSLGVASLSIYQYETHSSPPDPNILVFKILEQNEESINELHTLAQNKPDWKTDLSNLSKPALSVVTAANLLSSSILNKFIEFQVQGLTEDTFPTFITIISNNLSYNNHDVENNFFRFNQSQRFLPLNNFLNNSEYSKQIINYLNLINLEDPKIGFIETLLNMFIKLNNNIISYSDILLKILEVFSRNLSFYFDLDSPIAKLISQFFGRLFKDLLYSGQNQKEFRTAITTQMQPYLIKLIIAFPCKYSSTFFEAQTFKRIIKEEKEKDIYNYNIIVFITNDISPKERKRKILSFKLDEINQMVDQAIERKDFKSLKAIINYEKDTYIDSFVQLLKLKIPIDIKFIILNKLIPFEAYNYADTQSFAKAREIVSFDMLISIIKETDNLRTFKEKLFPICFYYLLESPVMINYFMVLFEKHYDFSPINDIKYNVRLRISEFSTAFKKSFQVIKNDKKGYIVKRPYKPELEQPTEFALQFVNNLIDDFINQPTWQVLTTLYFITSNLPFLFLYIDRIETIFIKLFDLFTIFEKYQEVPSSQKQAYFKKHKSTINSNSNNLRNLRNQTRDLFGFSRDFQLDNEDENNNNDNNAQSDNDDEVDENDMEIKNMEILFTAGYSGLYFLASLVSIPQIADKFFHWSLSRFRNFTNGQIASFLSILVPVINRETAQHVAVSYLIRYEWISLFTDYYEKVEKPLNKISRYVLASLLEITNSYFIKYIRSLNAEEAATCDELTEYNNSFEISFDHRTQISPNFNPWFSIRHYEFKGNLVRNMFDNSRQNADRQNFVQIFPNHFFANRPPPNENRPLRPILTPSARPNIPTNQQQRNFQPRGAAAQADNDNNNNNNGDNDDDNERPNHYQPTRTTNNGGGGGERFQMPTILSATRPPPFLTNEMIHQAISRIRRDFVRPRPFGGSIHDFFMNTFHSNNDPLDFCTFWSIFHLTDEETYFIRTMIRMSGQIKIEYPAETSLIKPQLYQLLDEKDDEPVDISAFPNIKNEFVFHQLDPMTQAIILRKEIKVPHKLTAKMQRYLITQPQWMSAYMSQPPPIVLSPQHYVSLQNVLSKINEIEQEEQKEQESKITKENFENFKSNIYSKSQKMIDVFLSPKFTLTFSSNSGLKKSLIYKKNIMKSLTGILLELASENDEILKLILDKINAEIVQLNPVHIQQLLYILVSLSDLYKINPKRYFSMGLFQQLTRIVGSPEIRCQSNIIESAAKLMADLTKSFYKEEETSNKSIFSEIEASTLQIYSILLNSSNIQTVNKAMRLISSLRKELKMKSTSKNEEENITSFANPIILGRFNSIFDKFNIENENANANEDDQIKSLTFSESICSFLCTFISKFPNLATEVKDKLLIILKRTLQQKDKNIQLISHIINSLCPKRTKIIATKPAENQNDDNDVDEIKDDEIKDDENATVNKYNGKPILIPMVYYNKWPQFWQIIFDNLSWFQDYITSHPNAIDEDFRFLKDYMELLTFKQKCACFRKDQFNRKIKPTKFELKINRRDILKDSFYKLRPSTDKSQANILSNFQIKFENEPGLDMGGLTRDWFTSLIKELFNENYCLFKLSENKRSYQPNPSSSINDNHLDYFEFTGLIIARAIIGGICVDAHLTSSFIKQILGIDVTLRDLQDVDKVLYSSLMWLLDNQIDGSDLDIRFTSGFWDIDMQKTVDLKENGENMIVTDKNKKEYVKLYCQHIMKGQIEEQTKAFLKGFHSLISPEEISVFTPTELDLLICGVPEIDVEDLKRNCEFSPPYSRNHPAVTMFFDVISKWGHEDLAKLLLFITGSSQVPVGGFKMMKESSQPIIIAPGGEDPRLPQAHTCMNTLDLPKYNDKNVLEEKLLLSISECQNFGFN